MLYSIKPPLFLAALLLLTLPHAGGAGSSRVPHFIDGPSSERPAWVSAELLVADGRLQTKAINAFGIEGLADTLERVRSLRERQQTQPGLCAAYISGGWEWEEHRPHDSLEALAENSRTILTGTVVEVDQGFYYGHIGSLLLVEVHGRPKPHPERAIPSEVLVFYPWAEIHVDGELLCAKNPRAPMRPEPGSRVMVFVYREPTETQPPIVYPENEEILFETRTHGKVSIPHTLEAIPPHASFDEIQVQVEELVARMRPEGSR